MFNFTVESQPLEIHAPVEVVWDTLLNVDAYSQWNPFTTRVETDFQVGSPVHLRVVFGRFNLNLTEWMREFEPLHTIAWGSDFGARVLLTALKHQTLTRTSDSSCTYRTTDHMSGLLAPVVRILFSRAVLRGFDDTATALKDRCETIYKE